jgi:hypothetical protein
MLMFGGVQLAEPCRLLRKFLSHYHLPGRVPNVCGRPGPVWGQVQVPVRAATSPQQCQRLLADCDSLFSYIEAIMRSGRGSMPRPTRKNAPFSLSAIIFADCRSEVHGLADGPGERALGDRPLSCCPTMAEPVLELIERAERAP